MQDSEAVRLTHALTRFMAHPAGILLVVMVVSVLCGLFVYRHAWVVAISAALLLAMGLALPVLMLAGVRGEVAFGVRRCRPGESVEVAVTLSNRAWYPVTGLAVDGLPAQVELADVIRARREVIGRGTWRVARRGVYPSGEVRVTCGFPLGVMERSKRVGVAAELTVWPARVAVEMPELDASTRPGDVLLAGRRAGTTGDLTGLRPYRRGDAVREIHWRQTARHGRLIVRERQSPAAPRVTLVLDAAADSYEDDPHREHAIAVTGSLLERLLEANFQPALVLETKVLEPGPSGGLNERLAAPMQALARLGADGEPLSEVLLRVATRGDALVVVTSPATASALRAAVRPDTVWQEVEPPPPTEPLAEVKPEGVMA